MPEVIEKGVPTDGLPWIMDWRSFDLPNTIVEGIRGAAPCMVAVTLSVLGGREMIFAAERAAAELGIRVLWWFGPSIHDIPPAGRDFLRQCVRDARREAMSK
jgi:hypothetical protein